MNPDFPILKQTLKNLERLAQKSELSAKEIEEVLAHDPALVTAVFYHAVNRPRRRFDNPVTTLLQAAMLLGIGPIQKLAENLPQAEQTIAPDYLKEYKTALARTALSGYIGNLIAIERRELEPGEITLASQLVHAGELALWKVASQEMHEYEALARQAGNYPQEAAYVIFGTSIADLGHTLMEAWGFPEFLKEATNPHQPLSARGIGPLFASRLAHHAFAGWNTLQAEIDLEACAHHLELDLGSLVEQLDALITDFNETSGKYFGSIQQPSLIPPAGTNIFPPTFCQAPDSTWLKLGEQRLLRAKNRHDIVQALLDTCYSGLGMNRVIFGRKRVENEGHTGLEADTLVGADYDYALHRFSLRVAAEDLFGRLMQKPAAVWVRGTETPKFIQLYPHEARQATRMDHFFCGSLFEDGASFGVIYADRRQLECALTASQFSAFKRLVGFANKQLARISHSG